MTAEGLIIKAISGAFYVQTPDAILPCKARGIFRKPGDCAGGGGPRPD